MNTKSLIVCGMLALPMVVVASITDPIADFKTGLTIPSGDKLLKWSADINGDGKNEVFLSLKSDFDHATADYDTPAWDVYIAEATGSTYWKPGGIECEPNAVNLILPDIDPDACYVGQITQLGARGIVTMRSNNPREGESVATIYAYTIEGNHLKYTQLAQYTPGQTNAVFNQYLADNVRTQITAQKIIP